MERFVITDEFWCGCNASPRHFQARKSDGENYVRSKISLETLAALDDIRLLLTTTLCGNGNPSIRGNDGTRVLLCVRRHQKRPNYAVCQVLYTDRALDEAMVNQEISLSTNRLLRFVFLHWDRGTR